MGKERKVPTGQSLDVTGYGKLDVMLLSSGQEINVSNFGVTIVSELKFNLFPLEPAVRRVMNAIVALMKFPFLMVD